MCTDGLDDASSLVDLGDGVGLLVPHDVLAVETALRLEIDEGFLGEIRRSAGRYLRQDKRFGLCECHDIKRRCPPTS